MRPLILACACLASCSTDVFDEPDGGSDASMNTSTDVGVDGTVSDAPMIDGGACSYSGIPTCSTFTSDALSTECLFATEDCCVLSASAHCVSSGAGCSGASFGCLSPTDCLGAVCCLLNVDGGGPIGTGCPLKADPQTSAECVASGNCASVGDHRICTADTDCADAAPNCVFAEIDKTVPAFTFGICVQ